MREKVNFWENEDRKLPRIWKLGFVSILLAVTRFALQANGRMFLPFLRLPAHHVKRPNGWTAGRSKS